MRIAKACFARNVGKPKNDDDYLTKLPNLKATDLAGMAIRGQSLALAIPITMMSKGGKPSQRTHYCTVPLKELNTNLDRIAAPDAP